MQLLQLLTKKSSKDIRKPMIKALTWVLELSINYINSLRLIVVLASVCSCMSKYSLKIHIIWIGIFVPFD